MRSGFSITINITITFFSDYIFFCNYDKMRERRGGRERGGELGEEEGGR